MFKKLLLTLSFIFLSVPILFAQSGSIEGEVTDQKTGETIPGANVLLVETSQGAATNVDGQYTISNVEPGTYTLRVTYIGYERSNVQVTVTAGETLQQDVALEAGALNLDEVVVTGYGNVSKREFTGSVSQVNSESLENVPVASVGQALQGNVAGATISSATGTPGAVQDIKIRGTSSINAGTSPLYVIDGVPVISGNNTESTATSSLGVMANISTSDIESITILKDAASTAKYGARGSNGVIVIETKDGRVGDVTYSVSAQRGFNNRAVDGPGSMTASEWDELYYYSGGNRLEQAGLPTDKGAVDQYLGPSGWDGETNTDWGDVVTNDDAVQQEYSLSARGGNEQTTFYASTNYFEQEGQTIGSGLNRISGKLNLNHKLDDRITVDNSFTGSYVKQNGILEGAGYFGSPVLAEFFMQPVDPAFNADGSPNKDLSTNIFHPVAIQNSDITRKRSYRLLNNTNINVQLMENFSFKTNFAIDYLMTEEKYYRNPYYGDAAPPVGGSVSDTDNRNFNYVWRNTLNYIWDLNDDNNFDFSLISESQRNYSNILDAYGEGMAAAGLTNLNTVAVPQSTLGRTTDWAVQSFTGLANYGFQDKLFIDASLRYEGNSRFASDERWGTFWSLGAGYILTEEAFLQDIDWLSFLKLRASYGKTGNASIGLNNYQALVGFGAYNDSPNIQPTQLGNLGLTWEKANSFDAGVEFGFLNDRIDASVTYFRKDSYDLLYDVPLSYSTGHEDQIQNTGELYNKGLEIELNANIVSTQNVAWQLGGNFTTLKNEVTELPVDLNGDPIQIISGTRYRSVEGYEVDSWYMREWAGVDSENGDPLWYMDDGNGERTTTNSYNEADRYYQGSSASPNKFGGLNSRIDVFGFYVSANMYYAFGHKVLDNWARYMRSDGAFSPAFGQYARQADYWTPENKDAENPKPIIGGNKNSNQMSSRFLYDGDYLRLKTLNIGYNIPSRYLNNIGLKSAVVYFLGQNLWTHAFDGDLNYDPETKQSGFTDLQAAPIKSVTFGVKVNF